ncbi:MAG: DNA translocase FtsK [Dehalococcoidia bacterium]|nr:DNA translocase FtsK [Dehalococcoidia bacterium]
MARAKTRRTRPASSRRSSASNNSVPDIVTVGRFLLRPEIAGTALVVLAVASVPYLVPITGVVGDLRDRLVQAFGLHVFTLIVLLAATGIVLTLRRGHLFKRHARHIAGLIAILVYLAGIFGRWYPDASVGTVDFAVVSAGGDSGRALTSGLWSTVAWFAMLPLGFTLLWPRTAQHLARNTPRWSLEVARWVWDLGIHHRLWAVLSGIPAFVRAVNRRFDVSQPANELDDLIATHDEVGLADLPLDPAAPAVDLAVAGPADPDLAEAVPARSRRRKAEPEEEKTPTQLGMDMETPVADWRHSADGWQLPPTKMLAPQPAAQDRKADNERRAGLIEQTLSSFGVDAKVVEVNEGPTITQFGVEPGWDIRTRSVTERDATGAVILDATGNPKTNDVEVARTRIRVNRITALQNDLALALAAPALRIEAPVPGKAMVGIEVPNGSTSMVTLRQVMESPAYRKIANTGQLPLALGAGVSGDTVVADLAKMPHLLIAGATGAGKSVMLNAIITGLLMNFSPEQLRFVMVDPKRVELTGFAPIPHLAYSEIIVDMDRVVGTLQAVINEMETRYRRFAQVGVRNIQRYNEKEPRKLPYWVVIIDELADLMLAAPYQVEHQLVRLAQLARATGIHLIVATQRPSVDVITGLIKANFPTRIAFAVSSQVDSRTILDQAGAEKLLGKGDMLYLAPDAQKPKRVQGVYVADDEIEAIVKFWTDDRFKNLVPEKYDRQLEAALEAADDAGPDALPGENTDDPMLAKATEVARESGSMSTSMLQRKLGIGYPRAARLMDLLEERGVVGPQEPGGKARPVLIDRDGDPLGGVDTAEPASLAAHAAAFTPRRPEGDPDAAPPPGQPAPPRPFDAD